MTAKALGQCCWGAQEGGTRCTAQATTKVELDSRNAGEPDKRAELCDEHLVALLAGLQSSNSYRVDITEDG